MQATPCRLYLASPLLFHFLLQESYYFLRKPSLRCLLGRLISRLRFLPKIEFRCFRPFRLYCYAWLVLLTALFAARNVWNFHGDGRSAMVVEWSHKSQVSLLFHIVFLVRKCLGKFSNFVFQLSYPLQKSRVALGNYLFRLGQSEVFLGLRLVGKYFEKQVTHGLFYYYKRI